MSSTDLNIPETVEHARILIVGGGPCGLSMAGKLVEDGFDVHVFERRTLEEVESEKNSGYDLSPSGTKALARMTRRQFEAVRDKAWFLSKLDILDHKGIMRSEVDVNNVPQYEGLPLMTIRRCDLISALADSVPEENLHWNSSVKSVDIGLEQRERNSEVAVHLENGQTIRGALLIGADGIHSRVRTAMFGDTGLRSRGHIALWATGDALGEATLRELNGSTTSSRGVMSVGNGAMFLFAVSRERWYWFLALQAGHPYVKVPPKHLVAPDGYLALAKAKAEGRNIALLDALLHDTEEDGIITTMCNDRDPLEHACSFRSILVGDALHPFTPFAGQGCSQALVDAFIVTSLIKKHAKVGSDQTVASIDVTALGKRFEALRLKGANAMMVSSRNDGVTYIDSPIKMFLFSRAVNLMSSSMLLSQFYKPDKACDPNLLVPPSDAEAAQMKAFAMEESARRDAMVHGKSRKGSSAVPFTQKVSDDEAEERVNAARVSVAEGKRESIKEETEKETKKKRSLLHDSDSSSSEEEEGGEVESDKESERGGEVEEEEGGQDEDGLKEVKM